MQASTCKLPVLDNRDFVDPEQRPIQKKPAGWAGNMTATERALNKQPTGEPHGRQLSAINIEV